MVADDFQNLTDPEPRRVSDKSTLLKKYDIPLTYLDYQHVENCHNAREIEQILHVLRSGEEGFYPDLIEKTEKKLFTLKPTSKYLRKTTPVLRRNGLDTTELKTISDDLGEFLTTTAKNAEEMQIVKNRNDHLLHKAPVRPSRQLLEDQQQSCSEKKRISSTDYASWDKYDADTEILKMELQDEQTKKKLVNKTTKTKAHKKCVKFGDKFSTKTEAIRESNAEKEKGNEFFKAGDLEDALEHYTKSVAYHTNVQSYNNRALVFMKLQKYQEAIEDCNVVLKLEPLNFKAHLRKAQSYESLKSFWEALVSVESAIKIDPNDSSAQKLAEKLRTAIGGANTGERTRLTIVEVDSDNTVPEGFCVAKQRPIKPILKMKTPKENSCYELIPIPGTSSMKPPHFRVIDVNDPREVEKFYREMCSRIKIYYVNPLDIDPDDCIDFHEQKPNVVRKTVAKKTDKTSDKNKKIASNQNETVVFKYEEIPVQDPLSLLNENPKKPLRRHNNSSARSLNTTVVQSDSGAGGEPLMKIRETEIAPDVELHAPYTFLKVWNGISKDLSYRKHAEVLRRLNMNRLAEVVGCKMDNNMFSIFLHCLYRHFCVAGQIQKVYSALMNLRRVPRFKIVVMLMSRADKICVQNLFKFLSQHGRELPEDVKKQYS